MCPVPHGSSSAVARGAEGRQGRGTEGGQGRGRGRGGRGRGGAGRGLGRAPYQEMLGTAELAGPQLPLLPACFWPPTSTWGSEPLLPFVVALALLPLQCRYAG